MRRLLIGTFSVFAFAVMANPAEAQLPIKVGPQLALLTGLDEASSLDGTFGAGARVAIDPPLAPFGAFASITYFFPEGDLNYWTGTAAAQLGLPLPMVEPYVLAGWQLRRSSFNDASNTENGAVLGLGVQLSSLFLEGTFEFNSDDGIDTPDFDNDPILIKGGFLIG